MADQRLTYTVQINLDPETAGKNIDGVKASLEGLGISVENIKRTGAQAGVPLDRSASQARLAVTGLSQSLSDSTQFAYGFRSGMISVGNNLDMVARSLVALKSESAAAGVSMKTQLLSALSGPSGIILALSAAITALTILPALLNDAGKAASDAAEGGLKEFADRLNSFSPETRKLIGERIERAIKATKAEIEKFTETAETTDPTTGGKIITSFVDPKNEPRVKVLELRLDLLKKYEEKAKEVTEEAEALLAYERQTAIFSDDKLKSVQWLQQEIKELEELKKKGDIFTSDANGKEVRVADLLAEKEEKLRRLQETSAETQKRLAKEKVDKTKELETIVDSITKKAAGITYVSEEQEKRMQRMFELAERIRMFMAQPADVRRGLVEESVLSALKGTGQIPGGPKSVPEPVRGLTPEMDSQMSALSARLTQMGGILSSSLTSGFQRGFESGEDSLDSFTDAVLQSIVQIATQQAGIAAAAGVLSLFSGIEFGALYGAFGGIFSFDKGGWIREPVMGLGMRSGGLYTIAERAPEYIVPYTASIGAGAAGANMDPVVNEVRRMRQDLSRLKTNVYVGNVVGEQELVRRQIRQAERYIQRRRK